MPRKEEAAASYSIAICEHGTVFVQYHDQNGEVFAVAAMSADRADQFGADLKRIASEVRSGGAGAPIGPCLGHA